jgi:hypothetical protein
MLALNGNTRNLILEQDWHQADSQIFWGNVAQDEHVVQLYANETNLLQLLETFVLGGIRNGDSVVIIATHVHIVAIQDSLRNAGFDPFWLKLKDQFIPIDADEMLAKFMVNAWPDENLFKHAVQELLSSAKRHQRQVRAFGEMVAILLQKGMTAQTIALENLWNRFCKTNSFSLFCAYPQSVLDESHLDSIHQICCAHTRMVAAAERNSNDVLFRNL